MAPDVIAPKKAISFWWLQGAHLLTVLILIVVWVAFAPVIVAMPDDVAARIRMYPVFMGPLLLVLLVANYFWLNPLYKQSTQLLSGALDASEVAGLVLRAARYPYLAFFLPLVGVIVSAAIVGAVQAAAYQTPPRLVWSLLTLASTHGVVLATISFGVGRLAMRQFLELPGVVTGGFGWEPDLAKRLALGVVCTVLVVWTVLAVMVLDNLHEHANAWTGASGQHPVLSRAMVALLVGGVLAVIACGLISYLVARDFSKDAESLARGLRRLASAETSGHSMILPVLSADEVGSLTQAFNQLVERIAEHDQVVKSGAKMAEDADHRQMEFLTVVSHDLRTPLHSIVGFSQLLLEGVDGELTEGQAEDAKSILKAGHHLLRLVDDVVDLSKIETGMMALSKERVDLKRIVAEALEASSVLQGSKGVHLISHLPGELPEVDADETRLRQILLNLVGNAIKFTPAGEVRVLAVPGPDGMIEVSVEDSGPGIPEENLDKVFEEFEQVRATADQMAKGTGLGLAICRRLVQLHGGTIQVSNRDTGGARFSFTIPVFAGEEAGV